MRRFTFLAASALALAALPACFVEGGDSSLTLANDSSYVLTEVYVAPVGDPSWGPNLLPQPLFPGDDIVVGLDCGTYDALVVDETGVNCELHGLDLCFDDGVWVIDDVTLDICAFAP